MAEIGERVPRITVEQLKKRMNAMKIGEVIGLACGVGWDGDPYDWFAVKRIDLSDVDADSYWVIQYFGGSDTASIVTDYNAGFFDEDLRKILKDKELLQEDGTVLIDTNDLVVKEG